jgi:hypothetical protein
LAGRRPRLEQRRAVARSFDAREICRLAADCYERGEALPATLTAQERFLAATFVNALVTTATENWWCDDPLPLPALPRW